MPLRCSICTMQDSPASEGSPVGAEQSRQQEVGSREDSVICTGLPGVLQGKRTMALSVEKDLSHHCVQLHH